MDLLRRHGSSLRRLWGVGIAVVLIVAVVPYPIRGVLAGDEAMHRIHDTVGSIHYLLWWAVPVLAWTLRRADPPSPVLGMWWMAVASAMAMVVTSLPSGDLVSSASILPLVTLLPLLPSTGWWRPVRLDPVLLAAAVALGALAWRLAPDLVRAQDVAGGDPHGARFHYGGMAAVYVAASLCALVAAMFPRDRTTVVLLGVGTVLIGAASVAWPQYDSSLLGPERWWYSLIGVAVVGRGLMVRPTRPHTESTLPSNEVREVPWHA